MQAASERSVRTKPSNQYVWIEALELSTRSMEQCMGYIFLLTVLRSYFIHIPQLLQVGHHKGMIIVR
jgi:hypothetical protein